MLGEHPSRSGREVAVMACAMLAAAPLAVAAVCIVGVRPAQALPSYARQTGQQCAACHNGFPELTPYGRLFKLNGYTFTGGTSNLAAARGDGGPELHPYRAGPAGRRGAGFRTQQQCRFHRQPLLWRQDRRPSRCVHSGDLRPGRQQLQLGQHSTSAMPIPGSSSGRELVYGREPQQQPDRQRRMELDAGLGLPLYRLRTGADSGRQHVDRRRAGAAGARPQSLYLLEPAGLRRGRRIPHAWPVDR